LLQQGALEANERVLAAVAGTVTPQGVVAAVPIPRAALDVDLGPIVPILDRLADPGNVGTILRTAEAAGVTSVIALNDTVDLFSPKVVRAGMGAHFHLNLIIDQAWDSLRPLLKGRRVRATAANAGHPYYLVDWTIPAALIIGSEAHGVSPEGMAFADGTVSIPMVGRAESLNAAVAASVVMYEALRQRSMRPLT
jgi:TrmH family RNA methyltransferase